MKRIIFMAIGVAALLGCNPTQDSTEKPGEMGIKVSVSRVKLESTTSDFRYSGSIEATQTIPLTFQTAGRVEKVLVEAGDEVKKDQLLATLDKNDLQSMYEITRAKYEQAKDAYDRLKTVHDEGSLPEIKWVEMVTNLEQAKLSMELSKNNLAKCDLRAPVNGLVGRRNIEPGMSSISLLEAPFELVNINKVYVKIAVPENEIGRISKGVKASISVSALDNKCYEGEISNVSPVADKFSRTYEAKILVANSNHELKPGMVCDVMLSIKSEKKAILIPYDSVTKDSNGDIIVFVVNPGTKRVLKQVVVPGNYRGENIEIISGLSPDQLIVWKGKEKLSDNSLICY